MMESDLYMDLLSRVISLEKEVRELRKKQEESTLLTTAEKEVPKWSKSRSEECVTQGSKSRVSTRKKSINDLSREIENRSIKASLIGSGNRGSNPLRVENAEGTKRVYLSTSKNYEDMPHEPFASWHTVDVQDACDPDKYGFFIFSPEDEDGNPLYFVLTFDEMQEKIKDKRRVPAKRADGNHEYYHFTLSRTGGRYSDGFVDFRKGEESNFTEYYDALWKLEE